MISPNGRYIASIISVSRIEDQGSSSADSELHVWHWSGSDSQPLLSQWTHLTAVALNSSMTSAKDGKNGCSASCGPLLEWTQDDALVLLVPVAIPPTAGRLSQPQSGYLLSITCWRQDSGNEPSLHPPDSF
jgi:hypothetical protein